MGWNVLLVDATAKPWCSYGTPLDQFRPEYPGDEPCSEPCYPSVEVAAHMASSNYVVGGSTSADMTVTYNYSSHIHAAFDGVGFREMLDGKRAGDVLPALEAAVERLGTQRDRDYWASTEGNAGYILSVLRDWARQYPDAVFAVH